MAQHLGSGPVAGGKIDDARAFIPLGIAVMTVSDRRDAGNDTSGELLAARIAAAGHQLRDRAIRPSSKSAVQHQLRAWIAAPDIDVIITNGGTGLSTADVVPEAARELFEREFEGFAVLWHLLSYATVGVSTLQSRACAGLVGDTVIYSLPGSNGACVEGWDKIISLQIDSRHRPCSIVELLPRHRKP